MKSSVPPRHGDTDPERADQSPLPSGGVTLEARAGGSPPDPLRHVARLGDRAVRVGAIIGIAIGLGTHGAASAKALTSLLDMLAWVDGVRAGVREYYWATYDLETIQDKSKPEEREEPEPEPEPEPEVVEPPPEAPPDDPYEEPPAPAEASKVLTQDEEPLDFTDDGFVSGDAEELTYGQVSKQGEGTKPTYSPNAKVGGTPGGKGTGEPKGPPPPPKKSLAKAPGLAGGTSWNCPFPPEADVEQIDSAVAVVIVTVRPDGTPSNVKVVSDPGHGFGRAARMCALGRRYQPGLNADGEPTTMSTPQISVRFTR